MNTLTEPTEIELFDLDKYGFTAEQKRAASLVCQNWGSLHVYPQKPKAIEEGCFATRRYQGIIEPEDLTVLERVLFEAAPNDFEWAKEKVNRLPAYLTKYFVNRYVSIYQSKGRFEGNTFLLQKVEPAVQRALLVLRKYKKLPTTQKVALLSEELDTDTEQNDFANPQTKPQLAFDFDKAEKNRKPVKNRLLAELENDELKEMAFKISQIMNARFQQIGELLSNADLEEKQKAMPKGKKYSAEVEGHEMLAEFVRQFGIKPPRKYKEQTPLSALQDISRMISEKWWQGRLVKVRKIMREHLAIAMGQVSSKASPYASWDCIREHKEQQKRNWEYIKQCVLLDEETGEEADLADMVLKSVSNPAIRRHELMVRCRGCEDIGNELGLQGLFLTLTAPSKYHNSYKKGGFIEHWNGASPRETQDYLNNVWSRIRSKLGRDEIRWFGVRVAEPHHDGTPHWHLLIWVKPEDVSAVRDIFISYATHEDRAELHPEFEKEKQKPFRKCAYVGPMDYRPRCDFGLIDPAKGTATGYIAKYISKNIDGYAMDDEFSDETGKPVKEMAKNVSAWKSRWNVRQYQFFGGAPVTTYRELRRFANNDRASFNDYLTQLNYQELLSIYEEMDIRSGRKLVGPPIPVELVRANKKYNSKYLFVLLSQVYQAELDHANGTVTEVMKAADQGKWRDYVMGQGGPFVRRDELLITNTYEVLPFAGPHGDEVRKLEGFDAAGVAIKTRLKVWTIKQKGKETDEAEAIGSGSEATDFGGSAASRSSVNNCTRQQKVQVSTQLTKLLQPDRVRGSGKDHFDEEMTISALLKGSSLRIDDETSLEIRPAEVDEYGNVIRPARLAEVRREAEDLRWLNFQGWDKVFAEPEAPEHQQPNLPFFGGEVPAAKTWSEYQAMMEENDWPLE